jgi:membrane-bound serine protease (ClpP class)
MLANLDGREITRMTAVKLTLHLAGARIEVMQPSLRDKLLGWLVNPNIALLMLVGGALLIYLEFNTPGTIVPGALGTLMVLLAIFALNLLPIRYTALLLLVAALVLMMLEAKFGGHGALAIAGIVCLTFGTLTLVAAPVPEMAISPWVAIAVSAGFGGITVFLVRLAVRARNMKSRLGIGAGGQPPGPWSRLHPKVMCWWKARFGALWPDEPVAAGAPLRVMGFEQMLLHVTRADQPKVPANPRLDDTGVQSVLSEGSLKCPFPICRFRL